METRAKFNRQDIARWSARILGTVVLLCMILPVPFDAPNPIDLTAGELIHSIGFLVLFVGLFLAWRWERVGSLIILGGVAFYWVADAILRQQPFPGRFFALAGLIGLLYFYAARQGSREPYRRRVVVLSQVGALLLLIVLIFSGAFDDHFFPQPWRYIKPDVHAARDHFAARTDSFSVTVYPIHVVRGRELEHDTLLSRRLAERLAAQGPVVAHLSEHPLEVPIQRSMNQAKTMRMSAQAFQTRIAELQIKDDYAIMAEILCGRHDMLGGLQYYIADRNGRLITMSLANSKHPDWHALDPQGVEGGFELLAGRLAEDFARP